MTPALLALVAEDAPTRAILCAGAGAFERAHVTLTQGIHVGIGRRCRRADRRALRCDLGPRRRDRARERRGAGHASRSARRCAPRLSGARRGSAAARAPVQALDQVGGAQRARRAPARPRRRARRRPSVATSKRASCRATPSGRRSSRRARRRCRRSRARHCRSALMRGSVAGRGDDGARALQDDDARGSARRARAPRRGDRPAPSRVVLPSRRAASSGCGVRTVARPRLRARAASVSRAVSPAMRVERVGIEHQPRRRGDSSRGSGARTASPPPQPQTTVRRAERRGGALPPAGPQHQLGAHRVERAGDAPASSRVDEDAAGAGGMRGARREQRRARHARRAADDGDVAEAALVLRVAARRAAPRDLGAPTSQASGACAVERRRRARRTRPCRRGRGRRR